MREDTTVSLSNPAFRDELNEVVHHGAQQIIWQTVEAELQAFVEDHAAEHDARRLHGDLHIPVGQCSVKSSRNQSQALSS